MELPSCYQKMWWWRKNDDKSVCLNVYRPEGVIGQLMLTVYQPVNKCKQDLLPVSGDEVLQLQQSVFTVLHHLLSV